MTVAIGDYGSDESDATVIRADGNYYGTVRRRFVVRGLHMSETTYHSGAHIPSHRHECPSFFMPLGGAFVEGCAETVRCYQPGEVGYHPPHEPHWLHTRGPTARGFAVEVGDAWRTSLGATTHWDDAPRDLSRAQLSWLMGRLYVELYTNDTARPLVIETLGVEISAALAAARTRAFRNPPSWLPRVRDLIHDRMSETVSLDELSVTAGVSIVSVIKAFRRHEGCTPGEYTRLIRLAHARTALATSNRPLSAIGLDAGFYDQSHFNRAFTSAIGTTPSAYRRAVQSPGLV